MSDFFSEDSGKPFLEHLEEFRHTLLACLTAFTIGFFIALPQVPHIINLFVALLAQTSLSPDSILQSIEVTGAFRLTVKTAALAGLTVSAPFILFFLGRFIFPGLTPYEKRIAVRALVFSLLLFAVGIFIAYKSTLLLAIQVMLKMHQWLNIQPHWVISSYVAFCLNLLLAFGLAFQMPVIILLLGKIGILTSRMLRTRRSHVIVILLIAAMILTPPDVLTQLMLALPLIGLYEACIWILYLTEKR